MVSIVHLVIGEVCLLVMHIDFLCMFVKFIVNNMKRLILNSV